MLRRSLVALGLTAALAAAGCGEDEDAPNTGSPQAQPTEAQTEQAPPEVSGELKQKPRIPKPTGNPPKELKTEDLIEGRGRTARAGDAVSVQYVGVTFKEGKEFDASWDRGEPFQFSLGAGEVIPGWDRGVEGMKVGGRRKLTIPPELAYGAQGSPPDIGPNETLVFVIDLLDAQ